MPPSRTAARRNHQPHPAPAPASEPKPEQAIARAPVPRALTPFVPQGLEQAIALAERIATCGLTPSALRGKPNDVLLILMAGHELGLPPIRALQDLVVIEGKIGMYADAAVALILSRPDVCEYFRLIETTAERATYETKRVGSEKVRLSWTIQQATKAGLTNKDPWKRYPEAMLRHRCAFALGRSEYPDLLRGCYDRDDETAELQTIDVTPIEKTIPAHPRVVQEPPQAPSSAPAAKAEEPAPTPPPAAETQPQPSATADPLLEEDPRTDEQTLTDAKAAAREVLLKLGRTEAQIDGVLSQLNTLDRAERLLAKAREALTTQAEAERVAAGGRQPGADG